MIAGQLAHLACEMHAAIGQQNFGFADTAGIKDDLAGRGIAGVVLIGNAEIQIAERHPDPLAAPADVDRLALERHRRATRRASLWRLFFFKAGLKPEVARVDNELAHLSLTIYRNGFGCHFAAANSRSKDHSAPSSTGGHLLFSFIGPAEYPAALHFRLRSRSWSRSWSRRGFRLGLRRGLRRRRQILAFHRIDQRAVGSPADRSTSVDVSGRALGR